MQLAQNAILLEIDLLLYEEQQYILCPTNSRIQLLYC